MIKVSHFVKFSEALSTTLIDRFALYLLDKLFFLLHNLINSGISILVKCKRTRDKESGTIRLEMYRVISCKSFTYLPLFLRINYYTEFHSTEEFQRYKNKKKKPTIFPSDYSLNQKFLSAENWGKPDSVQWRPPEIARAQINNTFLIPLSTLSPVQMCQHVLGSRCARSSEQDRQAGVGLRVPGSGVSALHRLVDTIGRRLELRLSDSPECIRKGGEVGERQRGERGARGARKAKAVSEDPCEIGKPRWNVGGVSDEHHRIPALRGIASRPFVRDRWDEALGLEEARPPESIQPGSGGRGSGARDCHGSQPCRVENGFYPPAWPQGGLEAAHRRESALFSWPLATSIQVWYFVGNVGIFLLSDSFLISL